MTLLLLLSSLGCVGAPSVEAPPPLGAVEHARPTTRGDLARANLDQQIETLERTVDRLPEGRAKLAEALALRASLFGTFSDLDKALALADDGPVRAAALAHVHRFDDALAVDSSVADVVRLARHRDLDGLEAERRAAVERRASTATWSALGDVLLAQGRARECDEAYHQALLAYRDVSPLAVAELQFRRGLAWGEEREDPARAMALYADATRRLPGFVRAQVHLAELEWDAGDKGSAIERVRSVADSEDPEPAGKLAEWLPEPEASVWRERATSAYDALLAKHPLAFANHAAEFFASIDDLPRARELAALDLANRRTPGAIALCEELGCGE